MTQLAEILSVQRSLEESFVQKMGELEAQIQSAGTAKDTVAKVADEFRTFRELIFSMLGLLRRQINECANQVDVMETRHRRKALVFLGVPEADNEDSKTVILQVLKAKLTLNSLTATSINTCHRLGVTTKNHHRPILVRFTSVDDKYTVWRAKTHLKGTSISVREFLTKSRQSTFSKARMHFGMRACWTQDGVINIKTSDGCRHKITSLDELNPLVSKYPKASGASSSVSRSGVETVGERNRK